MFVSLGAFGVRVRASVPFFLPLMRTFVWCWLHTQRERWEGAHRAHTRGVNVCVCVVMGGLLDCRRWTLCCFSPVNE